MFSCECYVLSVIYMLAIDESANLTALQEDAKAKLPCKPLLFMSPLLQPSYDHLWATHECTLLWTLSHHLCCKLALALSRFKTGYEAVVLRHEYLENFFPQVPDMLNA
nr:uncharacterized protein LOC126516631 isoform X2 [Dermacentor andersoni]